MKMKIGIRPIIDGRWGGVRESLENKTAEMAKKAALLITENVRYSDGSKVQCVIADGTIGGGAEAAACAEKFSRENVVATLSVTPCWCYGSETMDIDPLTVKAVWGFNGTERPGAVYLAAVMAAHAQRGLPAFSIYGRDVQDASDSEIPADVREKILRFARCAVAVGEMRNRSYAAIGGVSMGIAGSMLEPDFMKDYLGIRAEWSDMNEVKRRIELGIYDRDEYEKALLWVKKHCREGFDKNRAEKKHSADKKAADWEFSVKMLLIFHDIMYGNEKLKAMGFPEESLGKNAIAAGFQGQRQWTDYLPNGDFAEALMNTSFDWNGRKQPSVFATENDTLNGISMLFANLLTKRASVFADVRTYWSPEAAERVGGVKLTGKAAGGFIHLINSGAAALDGAGAMEENGKTAMKEWWNVTDKDIENTMNAVDWCPADLDYFRGGGFSSHFRTRAEMPATMVRLNLVKGIGPVLQLAEGFTVDLPDTTYDAVEKRTDPTWPTTFFAPNVTGTGAFKDVYSVMSSWGANHAALAYGHIGADLITLASMLRIPVAMHNVGGGIFRPHVWGAFGTENEESADYLACKTYGPLYR